MAVELKIAEEADAEMWDKIVESSPHGTLFHTWKCLKIIEKYSKTKLYPVMVVKGIVPIGCIPLFYQKKLWMKLLFCPPPHVALSSLGPVLVDYDKLKQSERESTLREFQKKVDEFIVSEIKPDYTTLSSASLDDARCYKWSGYYVEPTYNYIFRLNNELDKIWSNIKKNTKQDIQRAKRRGFSVREGNKEDMLRIYELMVERYAEQNRKVNVPKEYLVEMYEALYPSNLRIFVVEQEENFITGDIDVYFNDKCITWIGNPKAVEHANDLLTWECLKWAYDNGYKYYAIMGAAGVERLHSFYSKFNPDLVVSFSAKKYSSFASKLISDIVEKSAHVRNWLNKI